MPSILYSTKCYIKSSLYHLRVHVDDTGHHPKTTFAENNPLATESIDFTSTDIPLESIRPASTRLSFELIDEKRTGSHIPDTIILNHLLNVKQTASMPSKDRKSFQTSSERSSLEASKRSVSTRVTPTLEQSQETSQITITPNSSEVILKRRPFSFGRLFSQQSNTASEIIQLFKTLITIDYVDVSNSIRWNVKHLECRMETEDLANELYANLNLCLSTLKQRPRRLLAFVNPLSGKGRARAVFDKKVLPIFDEAKISVDTIYTERANHAQEYVVNEALADYDGLVCVGGDGMFAELCHGLLLRTLREAQMDIDHPRVNIRRPDLRIGIIPAGSTDAVVYGTTGLNDPVTSALQIIVGESLSIDITTVHNEHGFVRFMATMLAYGFFGDIIHQSDKWRCLGPLRYDLAGFLQFIRNTSYHSELAITLSSHESAEMCHPPSMSSLHNASATSSIGPDCQQLLKDDSSTSWEISRKNPTTSTSDQPQTPTSSFCSRNCGQCAEGDTSEQKKVHPPVQIKREGRYTTVNCLNMPCRCAKSKYGMSPFVHLGDGTFDLLLVKRSWRTGFLRFLWQVANDGRSIEDLPHVERYRVSEVLIRPLNAVGKRAGNWACDGELITGNEIQVRVHRQALNLFATGIQFEDVRLIESIKKKPFSLCPFFRSKKTLENSQND